MKAAVLFSGGKDSTFALWVCRDRYEIGCLVSFLPENTDSYMFHYPNMDLTSLQAESMGFPIRQFRVKGEKEKELLEMEKALKQIEAEALITGALASRYQKARIERVCKNLGMKAVSPLWKKDPEKHWKDILESGFRVMITKVACEGLGREWIGKEVGWEELEELKRLSAKHRFHLGAEGGEFETFVLDCPLFRKSVRLAETRKNWDRETSSGFLEAGRAELEGKTGTG